MPELEPIVLRFTGKDAAQIRVWRELVAKAPDAVFVPTNWMISTGQAVSRAAEVQTCNEKDDG